MDESADELLAAIDGAVLDPTTPPVPPVDGDDALSGFPPDVVPPPANAPPPTKPPEEPPATPPATPPDDDSRVAPLPANPDKKGTQYRVRVSDETEALALEMVRSAERSNRTLSLKDALAQAEQVTKGTGSDDPPTPPPEDPMKPVNDELAALDAKLQQFAEDESLYTKEVHEATMRRTELIAQKTRLELQQAEAAKVQQATATQEFEEVENKAWEIARGAFPDIDKEDSEFAQEFATRWNVIANTPNHPLYNVPDLPKKLAAEVGLDLGIAPQPKAAPPAQPPPANPPAPPSPTLRAVPGSPGIRSAPPIPPTPEQKKAQLVQSLADAGDDMSKIGELLGQDFAPGDDDGFRFGDD